MAKKEYWFSFEKETDSPTHTYAAKRIYWQHLSDEEWQHRKELGADETTKENFDDQNKPKKKPSKKSEK